MEIRKVELQKEEDENIILGQAHFIKTVEDLYEALVQSAPGIRFGLAFNEASGPCLVRHDGNDPGLRRKAAENLERIGAGHAFLIIIKEAFPINCLNAVKQVPEVCSIFAATANPLTVLVAENGEGRGIIGVIDGKKPAGRETDKDIEMRHAFLRKIGYKR
ncbi:MAG TPA: adenosine-specific kinase [Candidatus Mcinerneyibacteriales bacterium]|jgi:adenosine/AMP kinase|nr:adenosine-specific kinase [Candidatus Mcinerneyibacteriales bacterium]HPE20420.1 adenosine-specific kinase [Candidatus Mcinerneyibacteriales bacterium]HPJ69399.1 adenosine-specific kinase [Candidatus Mcinerneyibacteriales bacterium]HPQ88684.1 adenosine-specific kinase [Candidatus Mcinerneyibacteriales bacterium]